MDISAIKISPTLSLSPYPRTAETRGKAKSLHPLGAFGKSFTCAHQGALVQYLTLAAHNHEVLRDAVWSGDEIETERACNEIERQLSKGLEAAWSISMNLVRQYYQRAPFEHLPRHCLKSTVGTSEGQCIIDLFRGDGSRKVERPLLTSNTGFSRSFEEGTYYLENDIPAQAKLNNYVNPRLNPKLVEFYKPPSFWQTGRRELDLKWAACWTGFHPTTPASAFACYRSTLIIPITLRGNDLTDEFRNKTRVGQDLDRAIFGFFCADHVAPRYFKQDDVALGYMVADWMSLYLITQLNYTQLSDAYVCAKQLN